MCLAKVHVTLRNKEGDVTPKEGKFVGYKAFKLNSKGAVCPPAFGPSKGVPTLGRWRTASNTVLNQNSTKSTDYTSGFHIFLSEEDAREYKSSPAAIFEVEFKEIVAIGKQDTSDNGLTVVAKKMKLVKRLADTDKPPL